MRYHADDRRAFWGDIFSTPNGDINIVALVPHVPIAWHRHQHQDDRLFIVSGGLRVKMFKKQSREDLREYTAIATPDRQPLMIPRGWWHGYEAMFNGTVVLQFNGPGKWTGEDEERASLAEIPWSTTKPIP